MASPTPTTKTRKKLTARQQRFVEVYAGNGTEAARLAGYSGNDATLAQVASENLRKPEVRRALEARREKADKPLIASREDRQKFWTATLQDKKAKMKDRLKASELLGRSEADFTDKVDVQGTITVQVINPYATPEGQGDG